MWTAAEERQALASIDNYLSRTEKVTKEEKIEFLRVADQMGKNGQHRKLVQHAFSSLKKHLEKANFTATCKRFLILFDELLESGPKRDSFSRYSPAISMHEAALDWKVYRMLWAKDIADATFDALRTQISHKYRNFDLNKGFSPDNLERIQKRYARKGFTPAEITRYMESPKTDPKQQQDPSQPRVSSHDRLSSQNERKLSTEMGASPRRIPLSRQPQLEQREQVNKRSVSPANFRPQLPDRRSPSGETYFIQNGPTQILDPRRNLPMGFYERPQNPPFGYPQYLPPIYPGNARYLGNEQQKGMFLNYPVPPPPPIQGAGQSTGREVCSSVMEEGLVEMGHHHEPLSKVRSESTSGQESRKGNEVHRELLHKLYDHLFDCKNCGLLFQSKINLKRHQEGHVLQAQNHILSKEYNKACDISGSYSVGHPQVQNLLSIDDWVSGQQQERQQVQQQIAIQKEDNKFSFSCHFCQEELEVAWCEALQDWTLRESVKVKDEEGHRSVAHLDCFVEFSQKGGLARA